MLISQNIVYEFVVKGAANRLKREIMKGYVKDLDLLGCIQCGRCTAGCPVSIRTKLNIRTIINNAINGKKQEDLAMLSELWECTACNTCVSRCPKGISPFELLVDLRKKFIETGIIQPTVKEAFESVYKVGNPWAKPRSMRKEWMRGLQVNIKEPEAHVEYLIYICCTIAYDSEVQMIAKNMIEILNKLQVSYGLLGENESCCAGEIYSLGEEGLFTMLAEENTKLLNEYNVSKIACLSPHCFSTLKNQYIGLKAEVIHYTQLLKDLFEKDEIVFQSNLTEKVAFHDPCYLGKINSVFIEPRNILNKIPGVQLIEFERNKERSLCCEGGGGRIWLDSESFSERLAEIRVKDAKEMGVTIIAVSCPFCLLTIDDALRSTGLINEIRVADITELVNEVI